MQKPTILIAAGGTGGHVFPALALVERLEQVAKVVWLGTDRAVEQTILEDTPWPTYRLSIRPLRGSGWLALPMVLCSIVWALAQTGWYFIINRPKLVLVTGGYVGFSAGVWARLLFIPLCVCEQNMRAGWTNRILACLASVIFTAYPRVFTKYADKVLQAGNPLRRELIEHHVMHKKSVALSEVDRPLRVLILGGSQGARSFNTIMPSVFAKLDSKVTVQHQCGSKDVAEVADSYSAVGVSAEVQPFFKDMLQAYTSVDVVIARAGALTLSELMTLGCASIIVPLPNSRDDHQLYNARYHESKGACWVVLEEDLKQVGPMVAKLDLLLSSAICRENMRRHAFSLAYPDAVSTVVDKCVQLLGEHYA